MEEKEPKARSKKKHTARNATIGGAAVLLLLLGGWFGFGNGAGLGLGQGTAVLPNESAGEATKAEQAVVEAAKETEPPQAEPSAEAESEKAPVLISVQEHKILIDGKEVTLESLEETLKSIVTDGKTVKLKDDHAIKSAYDTVVSVLEKLDIPFITGE